MARFRKKPIIVEAFQYTGEMRVRGMCQGPEYCPGSIKPENWSEHVHTANGIVFVEPGVMVVNAPTGDAWPVAQNIFAETYDFVGLEVVAIKGENNAV